MTRFFQKFGAAVIGACCLAAPSMASADGPTLKLEGGVAGATSSPQADRFGIGGAGSVQLHLGITPWLDFYPTVSALALPSNVGGVDAGTAYGFGGGLRVKRPRDASNTGTGFSAASPWASGDFQYLRTGDLDRPGITLTAGVQVPTSDARNIWIGPFVGYQDVLQGQRLGFDNTDGHVVMGGISIEFGPKAQKKEEAPPPKPEIEKPKRPVPPPPPKKIVEVEVEETYHFDGKVQFLVDSAVIRQSEHEVLNTLSEAIKKHLDTLNKQKSWTLIVEGHASSEGPPEPYNQKLSERRAQAVVDYLKASGIPGEHITSRGFSSTKPVADNATLAGRVANRRVEIDLSVTFVVKVQVTGGSK